MPLDLQVGGYSTGMKTRLALARAVLHDPDLLLLDEPTSGLDPESSHAVLGLIDELAADGKTVVMCTHLLLEAEGLADQVVMMEDGADVMAGAPEELMRRFWPHPTVVLRRRGPAPASTASRPAWRASSATTATAAGADGRRSTTWRGCPAWSPPWPRPASA